MMNESSDVIPDAMKPIESNVSSVIENGNRKRSRRNRGVFSTKLSMLGLLMLVFIILNQCITVNGNDDLVDDQVGANIDDENDGAFDSVSIMPVSCINYNNGHMIKFQLFDNESNYKCHQKNMGTFVVSVAHYMRAYFNYQALTLGRNFALPSDVGYLNCVSLQATAYANVRLYAKIGCMTRETFTSTRLQLHLYKDKQCTYPYNDGNDAHYHSSKGYDVNGYLLSTKVDFRPAFYSCQGCKPEQISNSFSKKNYWYDDDYINSQKQNQNNNNNNNNQKQEDDDRDDAARWYDDYINYTAHDDAYFAKVDDAYFAANDDGLKGDDYYNYRDDDKFKDDAGGDDGAGNDAGGDDGAGNDAGGDDAVADDGAGDDGYGDVVNDDANARALEALPFHLYAKESDLKSYENEFWKEVEQHRKLADVQEWNMCARIYKYGMWCDEDCRAIDTFRVNQWSHSDIFLLVLMCGFMSAMMLLIFAKRVKAYEKANVYGDEYEATYPGLPPMAMLLLFILIMTTILVLANLKFVNETLVFSVVVCILLFIYMLKLTLFENRGPHLMPPRSRNTVAMNSMNGQLFD